MAAEWRYRGRVIRAEDVLFIRQFIAENPRLSRRKLSSKLCEAWDWKQANGALRERDRTPRGASGIAQSVRAKRKAAAGADRHDTADRRTGRSAPRLIPAGQTNIRRIAVKQSYRTSSLPRLRAACRRASEISGVGA